MSTTPLHIIGNWKQNPKKLADARTLFRNVYERITSTPASSVVQVSIAPPAPFLTPLAELSQDGRITLGAQDVSTHTSGAHTGEVGASMYGSIGASFAIIGHSERRAAGDTDDAIATKVAHTCSAKLTPVLCVGEHERNVAGDHFAFVESQLHAIFTNIPKRMYGRLQIAYEPIWAIGTGDDASPEDVYEMKLFIRKVLADHCGRRTGLRIPVLYGGSVKKRNAEALITDGAVDGLLVGGASLRPAEFAQIVTIAASCRGND